MNVEKVYENAFGCFCIVTFLLLISGNLSMGNFFCLAVGAGAGYAASKIKN